VIAQRLPSSSAGTQRSGQEIVRAHLRSVDKRRVKRAFGKILSDEILEARANASGPEHARALRALRSHYRKLGADRFDRSR
jgi:hypothetical protein